jgi:hypothetical protein
MDIDLLRRGVADQAALVRLVEQCAAISDPSDGVIFEPTTISVEPIRDATEYVGTRIRLHARLDNVRQTVQIDFGIGDVARREIKLLSAHAVPLATCGSHFPRRTSLLLVSGSLSESSKRNERVSNHRNDANPVRDRRIARSRVARGIQCVRAVATMSRSAGSP